MLGRFGKLGPCLKGTWSNETPGRTSFGGVEVKRNPTDARLEGVDQRCVCHGLVYTHV
jgi:hypothetical protein